ncbi:MAG: DUF4328 domain-containing protein [Thermoleophilia bacterium]
MATTAYVVPGLLVSFTPWANARNPSWGVKADFLLLILRSTVALWIIPLFPIAVGILAKRKGRGRWRWSLLALAAAGPGWRFIETVQWVWDGVLLFGGLCLVYFVLSEIPDGGTADHEGDLQSNFRSPRSRALWAIALIGAVGVAYVAGFWSDLLERDLLARMASGTDWTMAETLRSDSRQMAVAWSQLGLFLASAGAFLSWSHLAYRNLRAFGVTGLRYSPRWTWLGFIVPIWCVFRPFQVMREMWLASSPDSSSSTWSRGRTPLLMKLWWAVWLLSTVAGNLVARWYSYANGSADLLDANSLSLAVDVFNVLSVYLAASVVWRVTARQIARAEAGSAHEAPDIVSDPLGVAATTTLLPVDSGAGVPSVPKLMSPAATAPDVARASLNIEPSTGSIVQDRSSEHRRSSGFRLWPHGAVTLLVVALVAAAFAVASLMGRVDVLATQVSVFATTTSAPTTTTIKRTTTTQLWRGKWSSYSVATGVIRGNREALIAKSDAVPGNLAKNHAKAIEGDIDTLAAAVNGLPWSPPKVRESQDAYWDALMELSAAIDLVRQNDNQSNVDRYNLAWDTEFKTLQAWLRELARSNEP